MPMQVVEGTMTAGELGSFVIHGLHVDANIEALEGVLTSLMQVLICKCMSLLFQYAVGNKGVVQWLCCNCMSLLSQCADYRRTSYISAVKLYRGDCL